MGETIMPQAKQSKSKKLNGNLEQVTILKKGLDPDSKQVFPTGTKEFVASGEPKSQ